MKTRRLSSESAYIAGVIGAGNSTKINNLFEMLSFVSVADKDGKLNLTEKNSLKELILAGNIDACVQAVFDKIGMRSGNVLSVSPRLTTEVRVTWETWSVFAFDFP